MASQNRGLIMKFWLFIKALFSPKARDEYFEQKQHAKATKDLEKKDLNDTIKQDEEPWVDVKGVLNQDDGQIQLQLDWNDAFVEQLRKQGFTGSSEEQIVQKYVAVMHQHLLTDFKEGDVNEFT